MDPTEIKRKLREFILVELMRHPTYPLGDDEPLMSGGLIDSVCVAHIGVFIETNLGVYIPDTDPTVEQMDTLDRIAARVAAG